MAGNIAEPNTVAPANAAMYSHFTWIDLFFSCVLTCTVCCRTSSTICTSAFLCCWAATFQICHLHLHRIRWSTFQHFLLESLLSLNILHLHPLTCSCRCGSKTLTCTYLIPCFNFLQLYYMLRVNILQFFLCTHNQLCCSTLFICTWCCSSLFLLAPGLVLGAG